MRDIFVDLENCLYLPKGTPRHGFEGPIAVCFPLPPDTTSICPIETDRAPTQHNRNNMSYVSGREDLYHHMAVAALEVEGIEVNSPEELDKLMLRDPYPGDFSEGIFALVTGTDEKKRRSGARSYIAETLNAKKKDGSKKYPLTLSTNSLATRVLFDEDRGDVPTAKGVEYMVGEAMYKADILYDASAADGELKTVRASKEVIVSGGAFNSPQLLKLSGIGPRKELESFDIPVVADVPGVVCSLRHS